MTPDILQRAARIKLFLMDVDGVLTDGKLYNVPDPQGRMVETKGFDAQDGIALQWLTWKGIKTGVISGRESPATTERARQVNMSYVYQGHIEKIPILEQILADSKIDAQDVAKGLDELIDPVADSRIAELAEERKILAHLCVVDREGRPELAARDGGVPLPLKGLELPEIKADAAHHGLGGQLLSR